MLWDSSKNYISLLNMSVWNIKTIEYVDIDNNFTNDTIETSKLDCERVGKFK